MRAAAADAAADSVPLAESLSATSSGGAAGAAVLIERDTDAGMADADGDVAFADDSFPSDGVAPSAEVAELERLWLAISQQVDLLATNPVMETLEDGTVQVKRDANGVELRNNKLNSRHLNTVARMLGDAEENPLEHRAVLQLLKAALSCPCPKTHNPDELCDALPCAEHTWWTRQHKGNKVWRTAKRKLSAVLLAVPGRGARLAAPVHESLAGWCMNLITKSAGRLRLMPDYVRSMGAAALAAYGPNAFPCGMLSLWDPCVAFIGTFCDEAADLRLLQQLAAMAEQHVASEALEDRRPPSHAAARELLATHLLQLLNARLVACSARLDAAQLRMASADVNECCHGDAGPGAGKTGTLVARLAYLYLQGATPERVVLVTFTNRAVEELRSRVRKARLPVPTRVVTLDSFVPTFLGSVCREAKAGQVVLLSKDESEATSAGGQPSAARQSRTLRDFVLLALARCGGDAGDDDTKKLAAALTDELQKAMRHAGAYWSTADEATLSSVAKASLEQAAVGWFYGLKETAAKKQPLLLTSAGGRGQKKYTVSSGNVRELYDLMLLLRSFLGDYEQRHPAKPCHILTKSEAAQLAAVLAAKSRDAQPTGARQPPPEWATTPAMVEAVKAVLERAHPSFYMLDELQDTDGAQFGFIAHLSKFRAARTDARLTIVGDFDQSIYSFRGASPEALRAEMAALFPGTRPHLLEVNYRSTPAIVAACRAIIAPNYAGADGGKDLQAKRQAGMAVQLVECSGIDAEYERIAAEVDAWYAAGVALGKGAAVGKGDGMAVLFWRYVDVRAFSLFMRDRWSRCSPHDNHKRVAECREEAGGAAADAPEGALFVSTIHMVKGNEYEIVFLAGLGALSASAEGANKTSWRQHAKWAALSFVNAETAAAENRRMQFVAASRPRSLLHVSYAMAAAGDKAKPDDEPCEAVANLCGALRGGGLLQELRCAAGEADALAAAAQHDAVELMGEDGE